MNDHNYPGHFCALLLALQRVAIRNKAGVLALLLALSALTSIAAQQSILGGRNDHDLRPTPARPSIERAATIIAPGARAHSYNVFSIDTGAFTHGGVLDIDIQITPDSGTDGSFDLFPAGTPIPTRGGTDGTLAGRYDIRRGTATRLEYRFQPGQQFALGLEGNWAAPPGSKGMVRFRTTITANEVQDASDDTGDHTIRLTPASAISDHTVTIVAPGNRQHDYSIFFVDTRSFSGGGVLDLDIQIPSDSGTDGSFDLWPGNEPPPAPNRPGGRSLGGRYDVRRGSSARIEYRFQTGQLFAFGLEGNWFSPKGATGLVRFQASVHR